ncbi:MAG: hypothetical protein ACW981_17185 [Candidatus Hodarchaeales archaeon]
MQHSKKENKKWFGLLVLVTGVLYLFADFSDSFDFFGISVWTSIMILSGIFLLSRKKVLTNVNGKEFEVKSMFERRNSGKWFGFLVLAIGAVHLLADFSTSFDFFGVQPVTSMLVLAGLWLLSQQSPLKKINSYNKVKVYH